MIDLQQALVADHIAGLEREGASLRAERARDRGRAPEPVLAASEPVRLPLAAGSRRARLGRWLVGVGSAIAGTPVPVASHVAADDGPCADGSDTLSHAA